MTFGSLFAGIGGFDLGFERAGLSCSWQVEIDPFCRRVLAKHWPRVRRHDDVRTFPPTDAGEWRVDVICGGFPCQDISSAGLRAGIDGERSGLWSEYARIIRVLRPRYVVVENVAALLVRGIDRVLGNLAACGYDAEWDCIPASAVGAPHRRDRVWIVAYPMCGGGRAESGQQQEVRPTIAFASGPRNVADAPKQPERESADQANPVTVGGQTRNESGDGCEHVADTTRHTGRLCDRDGSADGNHWSAEPAVGRVADGVPNRVDRLRGLGNAVVPQVAEWIGRRLMAVTSH